MHTDPLRHARTLARVLDTAIGVPGTNFRFGLDPILGVIPGLGDVSGAALSAYMVLLAQRHGVSRAVITRMVANVALDTVAGTVPVLGDVFDAGWKSNTRNLALLEEALRAPAPGVPETGSRGVVVMALLALVLLAVGGVLVALMLFRVIVALFNAG